MCNSEPGNAEHHLINSIAFKASVFSENSQRLPGCGCLFKQPTEELLEVTLLV